MQVTTVGIGQVDEIELQIEARHRSNEASKRLEKSPEIGPPTATALAATVGDAKNFENGRQLSAWLGVLAVAIVLGCSPVHSQEISSERNATAQEIQGDWQLVPMPESLQPKPLIANPWPSECQWYSYATSGVLKSIDRVRGPCEELLSSQLQTLLRNVPAVVSWKYDLSPVYNKGVLIIRRSDAKEYMELWEPHLVVRTFSKGGVEFREGDVILYLADLKAHKLIWIRHLRRIK